MNIFKPRDDVYICAHAPKCFHRKLNVGDFQCKHKLKYTQNVNMIKWSLLGIYPNHTGYYELQIRAFSYRRNYKAITITNHWYCCRKIMQMCSVKAKLHLMFQLLDSKANKKPTYRYYFSSIKTVSAIVMKILDFDSQI